jgi:hypothetical protein
MTITPDDKDWTWVLERPCPDCGLDTRAVDPAEVAGMVREVVVSWRGVLAAPADEVGRRPSPEVDAGVRLPRARRLPAL